MSMPGIELIASRPAVCTDEAVSLDVLVRITPPKPEVHFQRPPINLALVLDRSGSMAGAKKMPYAREAAAFAIKQLLPTDRVSVTIFDEQIDTIVPGQAAADKAPILQKVAEISPRGSTDLHGGWTEGAKQAEAGRNGDGVNRVLLLSDGIANVGVTDPTTLATEARGWEARGITTTAMGLGADYNEDLLEAMANSGGGNFCHIDDPVQLADFFESELRGLVATIGQRVSLGIEPADGVVISDVLNDLDRLPTGRYKLSDLIVGMPLHVVVRLRIEPRKAQVLPAPICSFRIAWDSPKGAGRQTMRVALDVPAMPIAAWTELPIHPDVKEQEKLLMAARAQKEAVAAMDRGDIAAARAMFQDARLATAALGTTWADEECEALALMEAELERGNVAASRKHANFRAYLRRQSKQSP